MLGIRAPSKWQRAYMLSAFLLYENAEAEAQKTLSEPSGKYAGWLSDGKYIGHSGRAN